LSSAKPRVVLLTSDGLRHRYAATRLAAAFELVGVVSERKAASASSEVHASAEDREIMVAHLAERDAAERALLGAAEFPGVPVLRVERGGASGAECAAWVQQLAPEAVLLFGTGIVGEPLLAAFEDRVINLHLGLSPYYRGAATNFWPLVNREPECVGATVHLAVARVDAGGILAQARPGPEATDGAHELGTKALFAGLEVLGTVVPRYLAGSCTPQPQDLTLGRVYRRRDFTGPAVLRMRQNFAERMMDEYVRHAAARRAIYPIVELDPELARPGAVL
jgi:methionyl-tRNA formyltransferase